MSIQQVKAKMNDDAIDNNSGSEEAAGTYQEVADSEKEKTTGDVDSANNGENGEETPPSQVKVLGTAEIKRCKTVIRRLTSEQTGGCTKGNLCKRRNAEVGSCSYNSMNSVDCPVPAKKPKLTVPPSTSSPQALSNLNRSKPMAVDATGNALEGKPELELEAEPQPEAVEPKSTADLQTKPHPESGPTEPESKLTTDDILEMQAALENVMEWQLSNKKGPDSERKEQASSDATLNVAEQSDLQNGGANATIDGANPINATPDSSVGGIPSLDDE